MESELKKMLAGERYRADDAELVALRHQSRVKRQRFNAELDNEKRSIILKEWFGGTGKNIHIEPDFSCDYGSHIYVGEHFYANFNCTFLDVCPIRIGDYAMLGPHVQLLTPLHPLDAKERISGVEYGKPITIGHHFWAGAGAIILPGVTLGDNVVVGAGAVVTKSFGDNVLLAGNPARIIKDLSEGEV